MESIRLKEYFSFRLLTQVNKTEELSDAILAKLLERGRLDLARKLLLEQKHYSDLEEQAIDSGRLDICDELASEELRWIQEVYDRLR